MKIKKEFVDLIYNGEKKYEFRNKKGWDGIYKIKDKLFKLDYIGQQFKIHLVIDHQDKDLIQYYISHLRVDKKTFDWVQDNIDYFYNKENKEYTIYFYSWTYIGEKEIVEVE